MSAQGYKSDRIVVHAATPERWDDIERVFTTGAIANRCWCQWIRKTQQQARNDGPTGNRASLRLLIDRGDAVGLIAYVDGVPVGWCSLGPKESFGRLSRSKALTPCAEDPSPDGTWATLCFYVAPGYRGGGVARALLREAMIYAQQMGANAFEAYPVAVGRKEVSNDAAYPGTEAMLADEGLREVRSAAPGRSSQVIMRKLL